MLIKCPLSTQAMPAGLLHWQLCFSLRKHPPQPVIKKRASQKLFVNSFTFRIVADRTDPTVNSMISVS